MRPPERTIVLASRGSALALAQAGAVRALCQPAFPGADFQIKVVTTTGDKLQAFAPGKEPVPGSKGLFTKELEAALLDGSADIAVHSLKDLPTELPEGLKLTAVTRRADPRDVLIHRAPIGKGSRGFQPGTPLREWPAGAVIATSSTRRQAQLLTLNDRLTVVPIRGNVGTRLKKLARFDSMDGLVLAAAGLERLGFVIQPDGLLTSRTADEVPEGLCARALSIDEMLPCVGQAAIGLETRQNDPVSEEVCAILNDPPTWACVTAERAFLRAMGGGCLSPVAAHATVEGARLRIRGISFRAGPARAGELIGPVDEAESLGERLAGRVA